jgi:hypothetical protein
MIGADPVSVYALGQSMQPETTVTRFLPPHAVEFSTLVIRTLIAKALAASTSEHDDTRRRIS